jgi:hypothetical protein
LRQALRKACPVASVNDSWCALVAAVAVRGTCARASRLLVTAVAVAVAAAAAVAAAVGGGSGGRDAFRRGRRASGVDLGDCLWLRTGVPEARIVQAEPEAGPAAAGRVLGSGAPGQTIPAGVAFRLSGTVYRQQGTVGGELFLRQFAPTPERELRAEFTAFLRVLPSVNGANRPNVSACGPVQATRSLLRKPVLRRAKIRFGSNFQQNGGAGLANAPPSRTLSRSDGPKTRILPETRYSSSVIFRIVR